MNVIFAAQASILKVFHAMDVELRQKGVISNSAYWVADAEYYQFNLRQFDLLNDPSTKVLKEWTYTDTTGASLPENWQFLEEKYEAVGSVWNAILADRRLMHGRLCKTKQEYKGHYSQEQLKIIIYNALNDIDKLIAELKPDRIVTFVPATFGDILLIHAAEVHGIECRVLRSTKIKNYVAFSDKLGSSSTWLESSYEDNLLNQADKPLFSQALAFLEQGRGAPVEYEGSIAGKKNTILDLLKRYFVGAVGGVIQKIRRVRLGVSGDNHLPPLFGAYIFGNLLREHREKNVRRLMSKRQLFLEDVGDLSYVFYPMHSEPEVALSVYGREHQNQIETIRRIAQSIPLSWKIVIKEHPRSISYRTRSYYEKLLDIPNLVFADPDTKPFYWNKKSRAVVTVSGFSGFEAAMTGVPVIVLGDASFSLLPKTMQRTVKNMENFAIELKSLLHDYVISESHLLAYIMANMQVGVDVNLYSDLLAKSGRITMDTDNIETQISRLSDWMLHDLNNNHRFMKLGEER
mgnify:CR=1 FL=1